MAQPVSSEDWNQPRCWSEPSRYRSAGLVKLGAPLQHADMRGARVEPHVQWCRALSGSACASRAEQLLRAQAEPASMPCALDTLAPPARSARRCADAARRCPCARTAPSACPSCAGGRRTSPAGCATIASRRARPAAGKELGVRHRLPGHLAQQRAAAGAWLESMPMNHWRRGAEDDRRLVAPAMRIAVRDASRPSAAARLRSSVSMMTWFASHTLMPADEPAQSKNRPSSSTGLSIGRL